MRRVLLLVLAAALIAAGCGKESLAQHRFNTAAHALCKKLEAVRDSPGGEAEQGRSKELVKRIRALIDANRSLPAVARYLRDTKRWRALPVRSPSYNTQAERLEIRRRAEQRALGLTSCFPPVSA